MEMLFKMFDAPQKGKLRGSMEEIARLIGSTIPELEASLAEIKRLKIGVVTVCNKIVTVINRRMWREYKERELTRLRVKKHRGKGCNGKCNGDVTLRSSSSSSLDRDLSSKSVTKSVTKLQNFKVSELYIEKLLKLRKDLKAENLIQFLQHFDQRFTVKGKPGNITNYLKACWKSWQSDELPQISKQKKEPEATEQEKKGAIECYKKKDGPCDASFESTSTLEGKCRWCHWKKGVWKN